MQNLYKFDRLNFLTAGMPLSTGRGSYEKAFEILQQMDLDGMELEFVHGVRMTEASRQLVKNIVEDKKMFVSAHGPFYINLNSQEEEKIKAFFEDNKIKRMIEEKRQRELEQARLKAEQLEQQAQGAEYFFSAGEKVFHEHLGFGEVLDVIQVGESLMYTIDFGKMGKKAMDANYARLKKV